MPNYLARVAAAAGRTSTPARPPVSAPPVMPGPGSFAPAFPVDLEAEGVQPTSVEASRLSEVPPVPATPVSPSPSAHVPTAGERPAEPLPAAPPRRATPVPPAPPAHVPTAGARPAEPLPAAPPRRATPVSPEPPAHVPTSRVQSDASPTSPAVEKPAAPAPPGDPSFPTVEPQQETGRPIAGAIIRVPRTLRAAPDPGMPPTEAGAQPGQNPPAESPTRAARSMLGAPKRETVLAPAPPQHGPTPEPAATLAGSRANPAADPPSTETIPLPAPPPSIPLARRVDTPGAVPMQAQLPELAFAGPPLPPAQPGPPEPPAAAERQSRITIGRLDVQVANHPPPPAARPARLPSPPDRDILAGLYLDRFRLRP